MTIKQAALDLLKRSGDATADYLFGSWNILWEYFGTPLINKGYTFGMSIIGEEDADPDVVRTFREMSLVGKMTTFYFWQKIAAPIISVVGIIAFPLRWAFNGITGYFRGLFTNNNNNNQPAQQAQPAPPAAAPARGGGGGGGRRVANSQARGNDGDDDDDDEEEEARKKKKQKIMFETEGESMRTPPPTQREESQFPSQSPTQPFPQSPSRSTASQRQSDILARGEAVITNIANNIDKYLNISELQFGYLLATANRSALVIKELNQLVNVSTFSHDPRFQGSTAAINISNIQPVHDKHLKIESGRHLITFSHADVDQVEREAVRQYMDVVVGHLVYAVTAEEDMWLSLLDLLVLALIYDKIK
jgi:hypothetical protein